MASHSNNSGSNYSMTASSREEARRKHFLSLHKRRRFQTKYNVEESADDNVNNNNSAFGKEDQVPVDVMSRPSFPRDRNVGGLPVPTFHPDPSIQNIPFCRSFSTATYQPVYHQRFNPALCYPPVRQNICQHVSQRLRSVEMRTNADIPESNEVDDDDVFVPSGTRNLPNHSGMNLPLPTAIPYSPTTLQLMQSRKRAHSAGDMMGLYPPTVARLLHPTSGQSASHRHNFTLPNLDCSRSFGNNVPPGSTLPHKWLITDQPASSNFNHAYQQPVNISKTNSIMTPSNPCMSNGINSVNVPAAPAPTNRYLVNHLKPTASRNHSRVKETAIKFRKRPSKPQSSETNAIVKANPLPQTPSALKSSLSSRTSSTKKKVGWNDLALKKRKNMQAETKSSSVDRMSLGCKKLDVEVIKANPSAFISENRIGPFLIGPKLGNCPVKSISQYLVRKNNTSKYYMAKILQMDEEQVSSGKMLLHTENSLLALLASHSGVIRKHGLFKDCSFDAKSGKIFPRVGLILDCLCPNEYDDESLNYLNLQQYVIQMKRLNEHEAIRIFYSILSIVYSLHKSNVVHRDLKLGNMVLDKRTRRVILTNFCLGCHLTADHDLLTDQRGSPAYISPDVLSDKPYAGKPSDMWSLGVILYTMLYGQFPFYDQEPKKLFAKIKAADYTIPASGRVSANTNDLIRGLLTLDPSSRFTARDALLAVETSAASWNAFRSTSALQVVPDVDELEPLKLSKTYPDRDTSEEELTRAFRMKMLSDDEDGNGGFSKNSRNNKRRIFGNLPSSGLRNCPPAPTAAEQMG